MLLTPFSDAAPVPGYSGIWWLSTNSSRGRVRRSPGCRCRGARRNRRSRCDLSPCAAKAAARHRDVVEQAETHRRRRFGMVPGGRTAQNARRRSPSITQSVAATTAPAARNAASALPGDSAVSGSSQCRSAPGCVSSTAASSSGHARAAASRSARRPGVVPNRESAARRGPRSTERGVRGGLRRCRARGRRDGCTAAADAHSTPALVVPQHFARPGGAQGACARARTTGRKAG